MSEPSQRPAIAAAPLSVILFAHAFSTETEAALEGWRKYLEGLGRPYEIFLIQETRPEAAAATTTARTFPYEHAVGLRDAVNDAIRAAQHPLLAFCTCDTQYQPADLDRMLKVIDKVDLIVGYRVGRLVPPWRVLLDTFVGLFGFVVLGLPLQGKRVCWLGAEGRWRRWIARWIFGVRVLDPECPFRLIRRTLFERLPIQSGGPFLQVEVLAKANHLSCLLAEEPVMWTPATLSNHDEISFGADAKRVFRAPQFALPDVEKPQPV